MGGIMKPLEPGDPTSVGQGRYRLVGRLGQGGMGVVYFGRSRSGRAVAVKVVRPELSTEPGFRRRFADEVEAARRVGGFHTAPVVDADPHGEPAWLVTAFVPGPTLQSVLARVGALPADTLTVLAAGLAEALEAIHRAGVIHRDLKPANIIVAEDGPRVIDFGIARALDGTALTQTGLQIGTPGFLAPEQLTGGMVTPAVDMFALGVVLSQAAGVAPFGDGPSAARHYRVVHEEPDLTGVPEELRATIESCLAKDARSRPTPAALLSGLTVRLLPDGEWLPAAATALLPKLTEDNAAPGPATPTVEPAPQSRPGPTHPWSFQAPSTAPEAARPRAVAAPAVTVPGGTPPPAAEAAAPTRPTERLDTPYPPTAGPGSAQGSFGPPTGAYGPATGGPAVVPPPGIARPEPGRRRRTPVAVAALLVAAAVAGVVVWQPWADGSPGDTGAGSSAKASGSAGASPSASASAASGPAAFPTAPLLVRQDVAPGWPQECHGVIALREAATDEPRQVIPGGICDILPVWSPDGTRFAFTRAAGDDSAVWVAAADGGSARQVARISGGRVSWSPDGTRLAVMRTTNGVTQVYSVNVADGSATQITTGTAPVQDPAWSPDGKRIALCLQTAPGLWQIHLLDLTNPGGTPLRVTNGSRRALDPVWSPDGRYLAYTYGKPEVGTQGDIRLVRPDGTGDHALAASGDQEMDPVWSSDGKWVAYVRGPVTTPAVWAIRADGTGARKLTTGDRPEGHPSWR
ncbi:protein kinase domain-containing protein [Streptomyces sp.]|uniref:protein kinase domain-containing protein n=1 Tax=Streptomyces sp. TaxID=1931 RepID=UPI002F3E4470